MNNIITANFYPGKCPYVATPLLHREAAESQKRKQAKKRAAKVQYNKDIWLKQKIGGKCIIIIGLAAS